MFILVSLIFVQGLSAEAFSIHKHETALKTLSAQEAKALKSLELKVAKSRQILLEKYYNDLERYLKQQMRVNNLDQANKISVKKEIIYEQFKEANEALKPQSSSKAKKLGLGSSKISFLGLSGLEHYSSSYSKDLRELKEGTFCFKKGGDYQGEETWKSLPAVLKNKQITFLNHDKDDNSKSRAHFRVKKDGYVYMLSTSRRSGVERIDKALTSGGRAFYVYKYFVYKGGYVYASNYENSETLVVLNSK